MNEGVFYGLFFIGILTNYVIKLHLERKGAQLDRSGIRDGIVLGVSAVLLYQTWAIPDLSVKARVVDSILGALSLAAGAVFFIKGRQR